MDELLQESTIIFNNNEGETLVGIGVDNYFEWNSNDSFEKLDEFIALHQRDYLVGYLGYDLKNQIEDLTSENFDGLQFPELLFWTPALLVEMTESQIIFIKGNQSAVQFPQLIEIQKKLFEETNHQFDVKLQARTSRENYLKNVNALIHEIQLGNIYEINYCQEYFAKDVDIDPFQLYQSVNQVTKAPFSTYFSFGNYHLASGSPERFLKKEGNKLISEPIKGTKKRGQTEEEDLALIESLKNDPKEVSENVMIVDLVRNDLSRIANKNSVQVEELCKIYTFETVHQMISRISAEIDDTVRFTDILKALFPMGSMTGAPKISAMQLSEKYEDFKRGIYSGSVGIIYPNGDFDFNVVIRSVAYNSANNYLSCGVGGAITIESDAEREYEECLVKIGAIKSALS